MDIKTNLRNLYNIILRPESVFGFLRNLPEDSSILDIGCGNNSPYIYKTLYPRFKYTGIDVGHYNQVKPLLADEYIIVDPGEFNSKIASLGAFDAVVSCHNLEHVDEREGCLEAMMGVVKNGGSLYIAFPSAESVNFPSRSRTLNYYDDPTHKAAPPDFEWICATLNANNFILDRRIPKYQPKLLRLLGQVQEPIARRKNTILQGTWAYYGFESIISARKVG